MALFNSRADASRLWMIHAERARRIALMLSAKDAAAIEAYAIECEAQARQAGARAADRQLLPQ
jgi:hypothetical protein